MDNEIIIGVDIGGSHITSVGIEISNFKILNHTRFTSKIENKADKEGIISIWAETINHTINSLRKEEPVKIALAMPGPFDYMEGIALFELNDKFENLYNANIKNELPKHLNSKNTELRFINDATAFGIGVSESSSYKKNLKILTLTLGTGFGAAFIKNGIPQINENDVPEGGVLWNKPFKESIADDYISSRWCIKRFNELTGKTVNGVKEIAENCNPYGKEVFQEFGMNLGQFLGPYLIDYNPDKLVIGGNIARAHKHFLPYLKNELKKQQLGLHVQISEESEDYAMLGACKLYDTKFLKSYIQKSDIH